MYVFGYFFQKEHFKGFSKRTAHRQNTLGGLGCWRPPVPSPPAPEGLRLQNLKTRIAINAKISLFVICVARII